MKFTLLSKYAPSLVFNPTDAMNRFVTGVANLVKKEYHTNMPHNDMTLSRLIVYAQSIEESKIERRGRGVKREEPMGKINLCLRRELQTKISLVLLRTTMTVVVVPKFLSLLSLLVERRILGSVYPALVGVMIVERMITRSRIVLLLLLEEEMSSKLLIMVQVWVKKRRLASMLFKLTSKHILMKVRVSYNFLH